MPDDNISNEISRESLDHGHKGEPEGVIFDIQRFSIHDGPGIRTTVFFKGCPLRCIWCHNPESQSPVPEMMFFGSKCIGCGHCRAVCQSDAIIMGSLPRINRDLCDNCGLCAESCPSGALMITGRVVTVSAVMADVERDAVFYDTSRGGVTLSGGEPTMQADFAVSIAEACKAKGYHVTVDTCGFAKREEFVKLLQEADLLLFDLKHLNQDEHKRFTGVDNTLILDNLCEAAYHGVDLIIRIPIIPGCNDTKENVLAITEFVMTVGELEKKIKGIELLPYRKLGEGKYQALGRPYPLAGTTPLDRTTFQELRHMVSIQQGDAATHRA